MDVHIRCVRPNVWAETTKQAIQHVAWWRLADWSYCVYMGMQSLACERSSAFLWTLMHACRHAIATSQTPCSVSLQKWACAENSWSSIFLTKPKFCSNDCMHAYNICFYMTRCYMYPPSNITEPTNTLREQVKSYIQACDIFHYLHISYHNLRDY